MSVDAQQLAELLSGVARAMERAQAELDRLDAVAADGDHGATMVMGWRAVAADVRDVADRSPGQLLKDASAAFADVGGSIGPLWGTALLRAGRSLGDARSVDLEAVAAAVAAAVDGFAERGRSSEGDKTLLDAAAPASRALADAVERGADARTAVAASLAAAEDGLAATVHMPAARGRAKRLADRSVGHADAGAASTVLVWREAAARVGRATGDAAR